MDGVEQAERIAVLGEELAPQRQEHVAERGAIEKALEEALAPLRGEQGGRLALRADDPARALEPAPGRPPDPLDAEQLKKLLRKRSPDLRRACEVRRRERFKVTAYVAPNPMYLPRR